MGKCNFHFVYLGFRVSGYNFGVPAWHLLLFTQMLLWNLGCDLIGLGCKPCEKGMESAMMITGQGNFPIFNLRA